MRGLPCVTLLLLLSACASSESSDPVPPAALQLESYEKAGIRVVIPRLGGFEGRLPFLLNPASAGAGGIVFQPDVAPHTYTFSIPLDGDGDGTPEITIGGSAAFNGDPALAGIGFGGHLDFTMGIPGGLGAFAGSMDFQLTAAGREISGSGVFTEMVTGNTTTVSVDPGQPLLMKAATGAGNSVANACAYSLNGNAQVEVTGPNGTLASLWSFLFTRATASVTAVRYTDPDGAATTLPSSNVTIPCGANGVLSDWAGVFLQDWACLPPEFGQATLTLAVAGGNTIDILDEDPPASGDLATYQAAGVPGNPHVLRGFFIGGAPGSTYREDFSWTLSAGGDRFSQISYYVFLEGPSQGSGGLCAGQAVRQ